MIILHYQAKRRLVLIGGWKRCWISGAIMENKIKIRNKRYNANELVPEKSTIVEVSKELNNFIIRHENLSPVFAGPVFLLNI